MSEQSANDGAPITNAFDVDREADLASRLPDVPFYPFPHRQADDVPADRPVWRVRFDLVSDPTTSFGLDINDDVILGRIDTANILDLTPYQASELGVSRQHVMLRPTHQHLIAIDLGSTNGTWHNGRSIGVHMPHPLVGGDVLMLGRLGLEIRIIKRPTGQTAILRQGTDLAQALAYLAKAITSQLDLDDVLRQALEMAMGLTAAQETAIWLVDKQTNELYLEAERGIQDDEIRRLRLPVSDTLAGQVVVTGRPVHASRQQEGRPIKIKTGYMVEAVAYVPLTLEGITLGVLAAAHRDKGATFRERDVKLLAAIGDFAAIAVQNARLYKASEMALTRRVEELAVLSAALTHDLRGLMGSILGFSGLLASESLSEDGQQMVHSIDTTGRRMVEMIDQLLDIATLSQTPQLHRQPCNLAEITQEIVDDFQGKAREKKVDLRLVVHGEPYLIRGDAMRLYRMLVNLVDNALRHSLAHTAVTLDLAFMADEITIRVQDEGPGIHEEDLAYIFDEYYQGQLEERTLGTGLGLTMVRTTAQAHEGTVEACNRAEGGAEFIVTLPGALRVSQVEDGPSDRCDLT